MTLSFDPETLDSLSRRELQAIAKALAIKANSKVVTISFSSLSFFLLLSFLFLPLSSARGLEERAQHLTDRRRGDGGR